MSNATDKPEIVVALENFFSEINKTLFKGELTLPTMILQPERRLDFNFVSDTYHFVIGGRFSSIRNVNELYAQFLHEMIHVKLLEQNSNASNYHNAAFLDAALEVGFFVGRNRTVGWGLTFFDEPKESDSIQKIRTPSAEAVQARQECFVNCEFDAAAFRKAKKSVVALQQKAGRSKQYFLKYVCSCLEPHNSIRSGRRPDSQNPLKNFCGDCGFSYLCVDSDGTPLGGQEQIYILDFVQEKFGVGKGLQESA